VNVQSVNHNKGQGYLEMTTWAEAVDHNLQSVWRASGTRARGSSYNKTPAEVN